MQSCDRCKKEAPIAIMSYFNIEMLCKACVKEERQHPDYAKAVLAEHDEVVKGNYNFPGVGLPKDLVGGHVMSNGIKYTQAELIKYPLLTKIMEDMTVVAIDCDYAKLEGVITEIRYGADRETENEGILEIIVDFYIPDEVFTGLEQDSDASDEAFNAYVYKHYPHLNGTSIEQVIMSEEILVFYFIEEGLFRNISGEVIGVDLIKLPAMDIIEDLKSKFEVEMEIALATYGNEITVIRDEHEHFVYAIHDNTLLTENYPMAIMTKEETTQYCKDKDIKIWVQTLQK